MKIKHLPSIFKNRLKGKFLSSNGKLHDFIIVGAQKCGTTTIIKSLEKHPDIYITNFTYPKKAYGEVHFFNKSHMRLNGIDWYKTLFNKNKTSGEKTPCYMIKNKTMQRISRLVPNVKLIICLRDPVKRIVSHLNMVNTYKKKHGKKQRTIKDIINNPEFVNRGKYFTLINNNILPYFDISKIHISIVDEHPFEQESRNNDDTKNLWSRTANDNTRHINKTIDPILDFLDLEHLDINYNYYYVGKYNKKNELDSNTINSLKDIYENENKKLFDLIGREITAWI